MQLTSIPVELSFKAELTIGPLTITLNNQGDKVLTLEIDPINQREVVYRVTYTAETLPEEIKASMLQTIEGLYYFLKQEHDKSVRIYDFRVNEKTLRFACRKARKVFSLKMGKFINGQEQSLSVVRIEIEDRVEHKPLHYDKQVVVQTENDNSGELIELRTIYKRQEGIKEKKVQQQENRELSFEQKPLSRQKFSSMIFYPESNPTSGQQLTIDEIVSKASKPQLKTTQQTIHESQQAVNSPSLKSSRQSNFTNSKPNQQGHYRFTEQIQIDSQEQIDYDKLFNDEDIEEDEDWMKSVIFVKDNKSEREDSRVGEGNVRSVKMKRINSGIGKSDEDEEEANVYQSQIKKIDDMQSSEVRTIQNCQSKNIDFKPVIAENVQLKQERDALLEKVALLEEENKRLNDTIQKMGRQLNYVKNIKGQIPPSEKMSYSQNPFDILQKGPSVPPIDNMAYQNPQQNQSIWSSLQRSNPSPAFSAFSPQPTYQPPPQPFFSQYSQPPQMKDEWAQQFQSKKRPSYLSKFYKYFNPANKRFDVSYKQFALKEFEENFFDYDWTQIQVLVLDGNLLKDEGVEKIFEMSWPNLRQLYLGYNVITQIRSLASLPNLRKIDVRANPLNSPTKSVLKTYTQKNNCQILIS